MRGKGGRGLTVTHNAHVVHSFSRQTDQVKQILKALVYKSRAELHAEFEKNDK